MRHWLGFLLGALLLNGCARMPNAPSTGEPVGTTKSATDSSKAPPATAPIVIPQRSDPPAPAGPASGSTSGSASSSTSAPIGASVARGVSTGTAVVNGTKLYYEIAGPPTTEVLVFLHQFSLDSRMWDEQFYEFARAYRVLRYDARGFGRSGPIEGAYSVRDDLRALLDHLAISRAHLIGLSMGARYATDFALVNPQRVRSLVLVDPTVSGLAFSPIFAGEFQRALTAGRAGRIAEAKRYWLASSLFATTRERSDVMARVRTMLGDYSGWHFAHEDPASALNPLAARRLSQVRPPTLLVVGERSHPDAIAMAARLYREIPLARRVVIKEVGHLPNMESPAAFNRALTEFLTNPPTIRAVDNARVPGPAPCIDAKTKQPAPC